MERCQGSDVWSGKGRPAGPGGPGVSICDDIVFPVDLFHFLPRILRLGTC